MGAMNISPQTIKELREETGAGMMDCKNALVESKGDPNAATELLRKKGLTRADKKATRVTSEGKIIASYGWNGRVIMVEVNCETNRVGKDSAFLEFCERLAGAAARMDGSTTLMEDLMEYEVKGESLEATRQSLVSNFGENIQVRRMTARGNGETVVGGYVHMGKIGVLVELEGGSKQLCTDIAMHVMATNPPYATRKDVPSSVLESEKQFLTEQARKSGESESIAEKMVEGGIHKFRQADCLVAQNCVKDSSITIQQLLDANDAKMVGFTRFALGEEIKNRYDDFA
jgi:elongation factor Ts